MVRGNSCNMFSHSQPGSVRIAIFYFVSDNVGSMTDEVFSLHG
jgi:hypothetical protein